MIRSNLHCNSKSAENKTQEVFLPEHPLNPSQNKGQIA